MATKKSMDIKSVPDLESPNSRPMIIRHKQSMSTSSSVAAENKTIETVAVVEQKEVAEVPKPDIVQGAKKIAPSIETQQNIAIEAAKTEQASKDKAYVDYKQESEQKEADAVVLADNTIEKPETAVEKDYEALLQSKTYFVKINDSKSASRKGKFLLGGLVLAGYIALVGLFAIDAGMIKAPFKLPFDLIKDVSSRGDLTLARSSPVAVVAKPQTTQATVVGGTPGSPVAIETSTTSSKFEDQNLNIRLSHPSNWTVKYTAPDLITLTTPSADLDSKNKATGTYFYSLRLHVYPKTKVPVKVTAIENCSSQPIASAKLFAGLELASLYVGQAGLVAKSPSQTNGLIISSTKCSTTTKEITSTNPIGGFVYGADAVRNAGSETAVGAAIDFDTKDIFSSDIYVSIAKILSSVELIKPEVVAPAVTPNIPVAQ
jgi:hypothetical protein